MILIGRNGASWRAMLLEREMDKRKTNEEGGRGGIWKTCLFRSAPPHPHNPHMHVINLVIAVQTSLRPSSSTCLL